MKCSYVKCRRNADLILILKDRRRGICREHYKRILRHVAKVIGDGDYNLEDFIRVRGTSLFLREKVVRKTGEYLEEGRIEELKRITERLFS
mgnify:CR=1 FL=1